MHVNGGVGALTLLTTLFRVASRTFARREDLVKPLKIGMFIGVTGEMKVMRADGSEGRELWLLEKRCGDA